MADVPINDILKLAQRFIAIPSVTGEQDKALEILNVIKEELSDFVFAPFASQGYPSLLYSNKPDTKHFKIILNAHLDVVPGSEEQFNSSIHEGKLYGRGAFDMKAAAAVMIILFKELANSVSYPLALQLVTDEENGGNGTKHQVDQGVRCEFVIVGESGSNLRIVHETKGAYMAKLVASGKASHGAYPWLGDNAVLKLHQAIATIIGQFPPLQTEEKSTTVNITYLHTEHKATNRIPGECEAGLDIRYLPEDKHIISKIEKLLPPDVTLRIIAHWDPLNTNPNNTYIQLLQKASQQVLQTELVLGMNHGTSDLVRYAGTEAMGIEFGPVGNGQHDENEWVDIKSLENYYKILHVFLKSLVK